MFLTVAFKTEQNQKKSVHIIYQYNYLNLSTRVSVKRIHIRRGHNYTNDIRLRTSGMNIGQIAGETFGVWRVITAVPLCVCNVVWVEVWRGQSASAGEIPVLNEKYT